MLLDRDIDRAKGSETWLTPQAGYLDHDHWAAAYWSDARGLGRLVARSTCVRGSVVATRETA
jgi:hypothetical protein